MHLVTGRAGEAHVNSDMVGRFNAGIIGHDAYILDTQNGLTATIESANAVTIATGDAIVQGRHVTNESPETLTIQSGGQGVSRYDLIVVRYTNSGGIESATLTVITGTPSASPADPAYNDGSILDGETTVDIPLYRVVIDGLSIERIDALAENLQAAELERIGIEKVTIDGAVQSASGFSVNSGLIVRAGNVSMLYINCLKTGAASAGNEYIVGTITDESQRPVMNAPGTTISRHGTTWITTNGQLHLRTESAESANTRFYLTYTFIPASW